MALPCADPDELDRLAARLAGRAEQVRRCATDHRHAGEAARWVSSSARAYRDQVARDTANVDRAAGELERAAAVLRAHAQRVRETIAEIAQVEAAVTGWSGRFVRGQGLL